MIGVILAAGIGSRLRPLTNNKPKCLVKTAGVPILQYQIDSYREAGVRELIIIIGYEGGEIREYCKHIKDMDIRIIENIDYEDTNNMYSLYLAREFIAGRDFILNNADLAIDSCIVRELIDHNSESAVAVDASVFSEESMKVTVDHNGYVDNISKNIQKDNSYACSIDFYKFSSYDSLAFFNEIISIIEIEENRKDWTEVALQRMFQKSELNFLPCDISGKRWVEIDNYKDLSISDRIFSEFDEKLRSVKTVFFDLDGTLYVGGREIDGVGEVIERLRMSGKNVYFMSNNSSKTRKEYVNRLGLMGIKTDEREIVLSTDGLIQYLKRGGIRRVFVLGTQSLRDAIKAEGIEAESSVPEYVVVGYDTELTYEKLITACKYINDGVDILATHCDVFCPSEFGPIPDIGALLEMLRLTTGKSPTKVFGKPSASMISALETDIDVEHSYVMIVGDRLHTDILMAKEVGAYGLLVLSGETQRDQLENSSIQPEFVLDSVADMYVDGCLHDR